MLAKSATGIERLDEYDLDGHFNRLGHAIESIGAKRVVLDTVESLFAGSSNIASLVSGDLQGSIAYRNRTDRRGTRVVVSFPLADK